MFLYRFLSETSQNFMDYATILFFSLWNVAGLYVLRNNALFDFRNVAKIYGLRNNALFDFRNVAEFYGLRKNACFDFWNVVRLHGLHNDGCQTFWGGQAKVACQQTISVQEKKSESEVYLLFWLEICSIIGVYFIPILVLKFQLKISVKTSSKTRGFWSLFFIVFYSTQEPS